MTGGTVGAYPRGRAPATEFVNGLPPRRTGSDEEEFQVDPLSRLCEALGCQPGDLLSYDPPGP